MAVTGAAVYVGGHQRRLDNPSGRGSAGPSAVSRPGWEPSHPVTGKALPWNPAHAQRCRRQAALPEAALWTGHDSDAVRDERRLKLAFFPL